MIDFHDIEDIHEAKKRHSHSQKSRRGLECYTFNSESQLPISHLDNIHVIGIPGCDFYGSATEIDPSYSNPFSTILLPTGWVVYLDAVHNTEISELENRFNEMAKKWKIETGLYSITKDKVNETYLDLIAMGKEILPFIFADLQKPTGTAHWHMALKAITQENPIAPEDIGNNKRIKLKWVEWAKRKNIIQ